MSKRALGDTYAPATLSVPSRAFSIQQTRGRRGDQVWSGVKLLGVVGAARLECDEPTAESGELIRRQLGNSFGDFFDFHGAQLTSSSPPRSNRWGFFQCLRFAQFELGVKAAADAATASPSALNRCPLFGGKVDISRTLRNVSF